MRVEGPEHPAHLTLSRFVDGDLPADQLAEIGRHVDSCEECRAEVAFMRQLGATARSLETPSPPDVVEDVIGRRHAGERGSTSRGTRRAFHPMAGAVAAGFALALIASVYLLRAPTAAATRGELSFGHLPEPAIGGARTGADAAVSVAYSPAYYLAGEDSLRLRARVSRTVGSADGDRSARTEDHRVVTLHRDEDGSFRGLLPREPGDLFAVIAIEDFDGLEIDSNSGQLWEVYLERGLGGQPTLTALESRYRSLETYNWVMAAEWAEDLTREHPENPLGWAVGYWFLQRAHPEGVDDSVRRVHHARLLDLIRSAGASADPANLFWLWRYAAQLGETRLGDSLFEELKRLDPDHPAVGDRRVLESLAGAETAAERLERLDRLWEQESRPTKLLVLLGLQNAVVTRDIAAVDTWLQRGLEHPDDILAEMTSSISVFDELARQRVDLLRRQLDEVQSNPEWERALRESSVERASKKGRSTVSLKIALAGAHAAARDTLAAETLFEEVAGRLWRSEDIRRYVDFLRATGDSARARAAAGLLLADPLLGEPVRKEYRLLIDSRAEETEAFVARSRRELARRIESTFSDRPHRIRRDSGVREYGANGTTAAAYFDQHPTVLFLWDPRFDDASEELAMFADLGRQLVTEHDIGYAVVVPTAGPLEHARLQPYDLPVLVDPDFSLIEQLRAFDRPVFVVIDQQLRVVAKVRDASEALRIAAALSW